MKNPDIDWSEATHRKAFTVSGNEVIIFTDASNLVFIFISFQNVDWAERYDTCSTEEESKRIVSGFNIRDARNVYYRIKKEL